MLRSFNTLNRYNPPRGQTKAVAALKAPGQEIYALTTIKNFRGDNMEEFVFESDWVFVSREKLMEPRFQQHLAKSDTLTALCTVLAKRNYNKKVSEVMAKPPCCHCSDLNSKQNKNKTEVNTCRRLLDALTKFWRRVCNKLKNTKLCILKDKNNAMEGPNEINFTNNYLCRCFVLQDSLMFWVVNLYWWKFVLF